MTEFKFGGLSLLGGLWWLWRRLPSPGQCRIVSQGSANLFGCLEKIVEKKDCHFWVRCRIPALIFKIVDFPEVTGG